MNLTYCQICNTACHRRKRSYQLLLCDKCYKDAKTPGIQFLKGVFIVTNKSKEWTLRQDAGGWYYMYPSRDNSSFPLGPLGKGDVSKVIENVKRQFPGCKIVAWTEEIVVD